MVIEQQKELEDIKAMEQDKEEKRIMKHVAVETMKQNLHRMI
jgi:hypothetical protein